MSLTGTTKQIEYAADLRAMIAPWIAEWKAMLPATPAGAAMAARIDGAMDKLAALPAGRQIDIMATYQRRELRTAQDRVRAAGMVCRCAEEAK